MRPKISVIVPFYNSEKYIRETVESLLNQTLRELEIICVDDGSTDGSCDIVDEYKKQDDRIKLVSKPNKGYGHSMNLGISMATGEYVGILESDDYAALNMFERLYDVAKNNDLDFVKSDFFKFYRKNNKEITERISICGRQRSWYNKLMNPSENPGLMKIKMNTWTGIYRLDFLKEFDIKHNETPGASYQDNGFWFQTFSLATRAMFMDEAFYHVRRDNPNSSVKSKSKVYCIVEEYAYIREFLEGRPDVYEKFIYDYHKWKYFSYLFTLNRITDEYVKEFLEHMNKEYSDALSTGELKRDVYSAYEWRSVMILAESPEKYYKRRYNPMQLKNKVVSIIKNVVKGIPR